MESDAVQLASVLRRRPSCKVPSEDAAFFRSAEDMVVLNAGEAGPSPSSTFARRFVGPLFFGLPKRGDGSRQLTAHARMLARGPSHWVNHSLWGDFAHWLSQSYFLSGTTLSASHNQFSEIDRSTNRSCARFPPNTRPSDRYKSLGARSPPNSLHRHTNASMHGDTRCVRFRVSTHIHTHQAHHTTPL